MDIEQRQIREFMDKAEQTYPTTPSIPNEKTIRLRIDLIVEEVKEFAAACGYELTTKVSVAATEALQQVDLVEVADALTDINYVTKGAGIAFGIDLEPIFGLVQTTNMAKFGPGGYRREDGKWIKPPDWVKPNIAAEIARQMHAPDVNEAIDKMVAQAEGNSLDGVREAAAYKVWQNDAYLPCDGLSAETIATMRGENHAL